MELDVLTALAVSKEFEKREIVETLTLDLTTLVAMEDQSSEMMEMSALHAVLVAY